jgi:hypothetical protein
VILALACLAQFVVLLFEVGSTVTPLLFGYLADVTGAYTASWGLLVLGLLLGVGLLGWVQAASPTAEERAEPGLVPGTR